jgi:hypothetical protein
MELLFWSLYLSFAIGLAYFAFRYIRQGGQV